MEATKKPTAKQVKQTKQEDQKPSGRIPKEQNLTFSQYRNRRDLLGALLEDGKSYTREEVETKLKQFRKGKVN